VSKYHAGVGSRASGQVTKTQPSALGDWCAGVFSFRALHSQPPPASNVSAPLWSPLEFATVKWSLAFWHVLLVTAGLAAVLTITACVSLIWVATTAVTLHGGGPLILFVVVIFGASNVAWFAAIRLAWRRITFIRNTQAMCGASRSYGALAAPWLSLNGPSPTYCPVVRRHL
jgi:hypothetical protein